MVQFSWGGENVQFVQLKGEADLLYFIKNNQVLYYSFENIL